MQFIMGDAVAYLLPTMLMMTLMATGSGQVMGISSILIYDVYKTNVNPFRYFIHICLKYKLQILITFIAFTFIIYKKI